MMRGAGSGHHSVGSSSSRSGCSFSSLVTGALLVVVALETWLVSHYHHLYIQALTSSDSIADGFATATDDAHGLVRGRQTRFMGGDAHATERGLAQSQRHSSQLRGGGAGGSASVGNTAAAAQGQPPHAQVLQHLLTHEQYRQVLDRLERAPDGSPLRSSKFAPLRVSACTHRMPRHWAPCINITGVDVEYAEEVGAS